MENMCICDTHNDFLTEVNNDKEMKCYLKRCKSFGVKKVCASFWSSKIENPKEELLRRVKTLENEPNICLLHLEDLWWVKDEDDLNFLIEVKPFSCSLTWNGQNKLAGGCGSEKGLSEFGKICLMRLIEEGVLLDVAHLNRKSFWQVVKLIQKPIFCSHTGFYSVRKNIRNLTDKQIDFIVNSNGFIGLFFFDKCIRPSKTLKSKKIQNEEFGIDDIALNLLYFTARWGYDNIGIGSDFYGIENYPLGLSDYNEFVNLFQKLKDVGFSDEQIEKIFYKNFESFLSRNDVSN